MRFLGPVELRGRIGNDACSRYALSLVQNQPSGMVTNSNASALAIEVDDSLIPLVISDGHPNDATVCSLRSHYVSSPRQQLAQMGSRTRAILARPFLAVLGAVISSGRLGRAVYLNDFLFSTNPEIQLGKERIAEILDSLSARFPDRAVIVRSVNQVTRGRLYQSLVDNRLSLVRSRRVYVFDPTQPGFKVKPNLNKDLRLLDQWQGSIHSRPLSDSDLARVAELYRGLYLSKYRSGNCAFTDEFFRVVLGGGLFEYRCLEHEGELVAFTAWKTEPGSILGTLVGYDLSKPREWGLLRLAFAIDFQEVLRRQVPYHASSGAGYFKRLRGAKPVTEYDGIFFRHLSPWTRCCWHAFKILMYLAQRAEGESIDFKKSPTG